MDNLAAFIYAVADFLGKSEDDREVFIGELIGLYTQDLISELYNVEDYADLVELYEVEIERYQHSEDIIIATKALLAKIPADERGRIASESFNKTTVELLKQLLADKHITREDLPKLESKYKDIVSRQTLASQLKDESVSAEDALGSLV